MASTQAKFKDVEVGGKRYRIRLMNPIVGSYVATTLATKFLPSILAAVGGGDAVEAEVIGSLVRTMQAGLGRAEFFELQRDCLDVVRTLTAVEDRVVEEPLTQNGHWVDKDLEANAPGVLALTIEALTFNVTPFFDGGALANLKAALSPLMNRAAPSA